MEQKITECEINFKAFNFTYTRRCVVSNDIYRYLETFRIERDPLKI